MTHSLSEFELIKRFFGSIGPECSEALVLGIGDDCALIDVPEGMSLCFSIDTVVEGVHFPKGCPPRKVAYRALAAALSDLAAMGAEPSHFTLSLTLPDAEEFWLAEFAAGLSELAERFQLSLAGGDTTKGPLVVAIQVHGFVSKRMALTRGGAKEGHWLAVTGSLGDAGAGLTLLEKASLTADQQFLLDRYYRPAPRIAEGLKLVGLASACIDISDGLLADANHLAANSGVAITIDSDLIPISKSLNAEFEKSKSDLAFNSGDDYELLFSISEENWHRLVQRYPQNTFTRIGAVTAGEGVVVCRDGVPIQAIHKGFQHFE